MVISLKAAHLLVASAFSVTGAAATGAYPVVGEFLTPLVIAAAGAGSASAIFFRLLDQREKSQDKIARRIGVALASFLMGAVFGLFVGPSISNVSPLDTVGGAFVGGLIGFGSIGILTSPRTMKALGQWLHSVLTRGAGSDT